MVQVTAIHGRPSPVLPLVAAGGTAFVLWIWSWMLTEVCTTDASCTLERCPTRCDRPEQVLIGAVVGLAVVTAIGVWRAAPARLIVGPQIVVAVAAGAAMLLASR